MWQQILTAGGILITASMAAAAAEPSACAAIVDATARLACYDRHNAPQAKPEAVEPAAEPPGPGATPAPPVVESERFGAESLPTKAGDPEVPDAIESRISGPFKGWSKDTEFQLDNGQVWRCVNCRDMYHHIESPAVTVKRGFMGNYWLKVEGLNTRASVKRIK
ncbi:MAG: hypothetical protein M3O62_12980 [Pseudomonadota bacterium]|nr:hypothetical protein [Pseudomonadota bacterium]